MNCPNCQSENPEDFNFCKSCGKELVHPKTCPTCGYQNPVDAKFCNDCGRSLLPNQPGSKNTSQPAHTPPSQVPAPQSSYPNQQVQPAVVYIREEQTKPAKPRFNLFRFIWRFASSLVSGYILTEITKLLF